jgi:hypothetical protein
MALVKTTLETALNAAFQKAQADKTDGAQATLCSDLATAIDTYIKTATVTTTDVTTCGAGAGTGTGTGTIS